MTDDILRFLHSNISREEETTKHVVNYVYDIAKGESARFIYGEMHSALLIPDHVELLRHSFHQRDEGIIIELGVFEGASINRLASWAPNNVINGFDAFLGLKEDWVGHRFAAGHFNRNGEPPSVAGNVQLHVGWIQDTLPIFLGSLPSSCISFVHFDLDTYRSTFDALSLLTNHLSDKTILVFDDFHSFPGWKFGEKRAFEEWIILSGFSYRYIAFAWEQAAIELCRKA